MKSSLRQQLAGSVLTVALFLSTAAAADPAPSLIPSLGPDGRDISLKSAKDHTVKGWLPNDWDDNTEWAPVSVTYSKITDVPEKIGVGLRIKVESVDEGGQMQLTSYASLRNYSPGRIYSVTGWVRSPQHLAMTVAARQAEEPYEAYHEQEVATESDWKQFVFEFTPKKEIKALTMFFVKEVGTVDLAGVVVKDEGAAN